MWAYASHEERGRRKGGWLTRRIRLARRQIPSTATAAGARREKLHSGHEQVLVSARSLSAGVGLLRRWEYVGRTLCPGMLSVYSM